MSDGHIRQLPYPYRAALAICSDLDETPDSRVYRESMRFLNTTETTSMGAGVGLEIGNTIYFDMPPDQFAYWNTDDSGRAMVRDLIRSGHIDCFHSYGDLAATRSHAARALEELERYGCQIKVWVDHGTAISNFGADIMAGSGDVSESPAYHADLTLGYGVRYVWMGRVTSVTGQGVPRNWKPILNSAHLAKSAETLAKEAAKVVLANLGNEKFRLHASNELLRQTTLRNGHEVTEFMRCNPHWGGVSSCETAAGISEVLTDQFLKTLASSEGSCILYTHLGKIQSETQPFNSATCDAFRRLATCSRDGEILVTTTRRLLDYARMRQSVSVKIERNARHAVARVSRLQRDLDLSGLTLQVAGVDTLELFIDDEPAPAVIRNPAQGDVASISVPWIRLQFPVL